MAKEIFSPFPVANDQILIEAGEWLDDKDQPLIDNELLSKRWSPNSTLKIYRDLKFDLKKLIDQTGITEKDTIRIANHWYSPGTNIRSSQNNDTYQDITVKKDIVELRHNSHLSIPGPLISDQLLLTTSIILLKKNINDINSASIRGSILWQSNQNINLEGKQPLFPIESISFSQSYNNANWYLDISEDLHSTISGGIKLFLNSNKKQFIDDILKDSKFLNLIFHNLAKQIIEHCLFDDEFQSIEKIDFTFYPNDSIGDLALRLIAQINNSNPRKLFTLVRTRPIEFDRLIQHTFSIAS